MKFEYFHKDTLLSTVTYDPVTKKGVSVSTGSELLPFPEHPTWKQLMNFFEDRCFERGRGDVRQILKVLELDFYDPYLIAQKTRGQLWDDFYWIRFEGDTVTYEDIKLRN